MPAVTQVLQSLTKVRHASSHRSAASRDPARFQMAEVPPSTYNSTPFTKLESSEARNSATAAIFSGPPIFPRGTRDSNISLVYLTKKRSSGRDGRRGRSSATSASAARIGGKDGAAGDPPKLH